MSASPAAVEAREEIDCRRALLSCRSGGSSLGQLVSDSEPGAVAGSGGGLASVLALLLAVVCGCLLRSGSFTLSSVAVEVDSGVREDDDDDDAVGCIRRPRRGR